MNKEQKYFIFLIAIIVILAGSFGVYAFTHKNDNTCKSEETDAIKFKREYEEFNDQTYENTEIKYFDVKLSSNNLFKYVTAKEAVEFLKEGTGVIYFGFPRCPWCRSLVPYLDEVGKRVGIKEIKYLNILDIRDLYVVEGKKAVIDKEGTKEYYEILELLDKYLEDYVAKDEAGKEYKTGEKRLYAPTTVVVKDGKIVGFNEGTVDSQAKFVALTDEEIEELKTTLTDMFTKVSSTMCTESAC